jgi:hypothetical protein
MILFFFRIAQLRIVMDSKGRAEQMLCPNNNTMNSLAYLLGFCLKQWRIIYAKIGVIIPRFYKSSEYSL